ncbi:hypothetical protein LCGC14_1633420 [marine sediment metagenome]|uniref:Uncharacterized protein n=1 Tax=marine sediment metagenome TaxID=412755 RepID=A0A0F9I1Z2_9ZZZZ
MTWKELLDDIKEMSSEEQSESVTIWRDDCEHTGQAIYIDRVTEGSELSHILNLDVPYIVYSE